MTFDLGSVPAKVPGRKPQREKITKRAARRRFTVSAWRLFSLALDLISRGHIAGLPRYNHDSTATQRFSRTSFQLS